MSSRDGLEKASIAEGTARAAEAGDVEPLRRPESAAIRVRFALARNDTGSQKSSPQRLIGWLSSSLMVAAILGSAALLFYDAGPQLVAFFRMLMVTLPRALGWLDHSHLSALPLLLAGASYIVLQVVLRPAPMEMVRRLMLGSAFLLWGVVQLMPEGALATGLGDLVIALYIFDLGLMVQAELERM